MGGRGKVFCKRLLNFSYHKMCGIPWLVEGLLLLCFISSTHLCWTYTRWI